MSGDKKLFNVSELVLLTILVLLVALSRVYWGEGYFPMVVWKGELTFHDTFVNLGQITKLPHDELLKTHKSVLYQLEDMQVITGSDPELESIRSRRWLHHRRRENNSQKTPEAAPKSIDEKNSKSD